MSSARKNLAWSEAPLPELLRLSWPICVSLLSFGVMTLVDTLFVSGIGTAAIAGVGLAGTATFAVICFPMGLLRGVKVLVSQAVGAGRREELGSYLGAGLVAALLLAIASVAVGEVIAELLPYIAASPAAGEAASRYLHLRILGAPIILTFVAIREHRYGQGDTRSSMIASLIGNAVNIALNYWWVVVLERGVDGSAQATLAGHSVELLVLVLAQRSAEGFPIRGTRPVHLLKLVRVGSPTGLQFLLEMGSFAMLTTIVSSFGEIDMAAHQIVLQVVHFSFLPTVALAEAGSVLAGNAVGAHRDDLVVPLARKAAITATAYTGAFTLLMLVAGEAIIGLFNAPAALLATALPIMRVAACFQIADGIATTTRGVLRGTGDVRVPARMGIACAWLCTPPLALLLGGVAGLGALGGWIGLLLEITALAVLCWARLVRGDWRALAHESRSRLREDDLAALAAAA